MFVCFCCLHVECRVCHRLHVTKCWTVRGAQLCQSMQNGNLHRTEAIQQRSFMTAARQNEEKLLLLWAEGWKERGGGGTGKGNACVGSTSLPAHASQLLFADDKILQRHQQRGDEWIEAWLFVFVSGCRQHDPTEALKKGEEVNGLRQSALLNCVKRIGELEGAFANQLFGLCFLPKGLRLESSLVRCLRSASEKRRHARMSLLKTTSPLFRLSKSLV